MTPRFIYVEVEESANCEFGVSLAFKAVASPRPVRAVRLYDDDPAGELWEVTGWSSGDGGTPVPALGAPVEDSGAGEAYLIWGGDWGIRIRRPGSGPWDAATAGQRGDTHFVLSDAEDVLFAEAQDSVVE